jgi:signal transduction histidine kinase
MPRQLPAPPDLRDQLSRHRTIAGIPAWELDWMLSHGRVMHYERGERPWIREEIDYLVIMLSGLSAIYLGRGGGTGTARVMSWSAGDVSGRLPYSRMGKSPGEAVVEEAMTTFEIHRDDFAELTRECPALTEKLVHVMIDRARHFKLHDLQEEKMKSLGRMAAGLAHELNNPSAATARSARLLAEAVKQGDEAAQQIICAELGGDHRKAIVNLRERPAIPFDTGSFSTLEVSDREEEIADWLEDRGVDPQSAEPLVESGVTVAELDELAATFPPALLAASLTWIAAGQRTRWLAEEIARSSDRINGLVRDIRQFSYMDQAPHPEPTDVRPGIIGAIRLLDHKARGKSVEISATVPEDLPSIHVYGGEINQVWVNLLENALDAVERGGRISISAHSDGDRLTVVVADDGHGIPESDRHKVFDPFFTTKPVGQGTGLGLDIAREMVRRNHGDLTFESEPGRTEFRASFPISTLGE